ncbi:MAG TPA: Hsp20/alpha crystallin family protein [Sedimentisphaerales bacterium]|nr:Hsp20/alpha crystallin family protein [Sedimentisphaerales bacterium]
MVIGDLIPKKRRDELTSRVDLENPFEALHREMDSLFNSFAKGMDIVPFGLGIRQSGFMPKVNVAEDEKALTVTAELPGMDEKDIEVTLTKDSMTLKGEKKAEKEEKDKGYYRMERSFGSFTRTIPLSAEIDEDKVEAKFGKGVLTIKMPKTVRAQAAYKKIEVKGE